jgi:hypothetical protein
MSELRVHHTTYEAFETQLLRTITAGSPTNEVCDAARALVENCFTRRSFAEWLIDHFPDLLLAFSEKLMAPVFAKRRSIAATPLKNVVVSSVENEIAA